MRATIILPTFEIITYLHTTMVHNVHLSDAKSLCYADYKKVFWLRSLIGFALKGYLSTGVVVQ